jgi:hypothetical protein
VQTRGLAGNDNVDISEGAGEFIERESDGLPGSKRTANVQSNEAIHMGNGLTATHVWTLAVVGL